MSLTRIEVLKYARVGLTNKLNELDAEIKSLDGGSQDVSSSEGQLAKRKRRGWTSAQRDKFRNTWRKKHLVSSK